MGLRDLFRRREEPSLNHSGVDPADAPVTAQEGMAETDTYVDEYGNRRKLSPERKAEMTANIDRISVSGGQGLIPGVMPEPVVPVDGDGVPVVNDDGAPVDISDPSVWDVPAYPDDARDVGGSGDSSGSGDAGGSGDSGGGDSGGGGGGD